MEKMFKDSGMDPKQMPKNEDIEKMINSVNMDFGFKPKPKKEKKKSNFNLFKKR